MRALVFDVSACLPWCYEDETNALSDVILEWAASGAELHVPSIWPLEIANAIIHGVRRKRLDEERARDFLLSLRFLDFHVAPVPTIADLLRIYDVATKHHLTSYDATYLDLAMRTGLPIASLDEALRKAAVAEKVVLVMPEA